MRYNIDWDKAKVVRDSDGEYGSKAEALKWLKRGLQAMLYDYKYDLKIIESEVRASKRTIKRCAKNLERVRSMKV